LLLAPTNIEQYASDPGNISIGITNQAFVDPDNAIAEGDETNNADSQDTTVKSKVNLTVTKEGPDSAHQNDTADYVIKVKNNKVDGGATAFGVRMVDSLPVGLLPLSVKADPGNFNCSLFENPVNYVDCTGDLGAGDEVTITVHVFVTADGGPLDNEACVDPDHKIAETNELDNCRHLITVVVPPAPNLLMNKTASSNSVTAGQELTYTLTVSNVGDGATTAPVLVTDSLPANVTLVNTNPDAGFDCTASTTTNVSCTLPSLDAGAAAAIKVIVTVNDGVTTPISNTATASGGGDPTPSSSTVKTFIGGAGIDLVLTSVDDQPDPVAAGAIVTYKITVLNSGTADSDAFDVTQTFDKLTGMHLVSAAGSEGFTCSLTGLTVTCHGSLLAGKTTTLTIRFDTDASAVPGVTSDVKVDSGDAITESDEGNNTDTEVTTISAAFCSSCIDLVMGPIFAAPEPVANGDEVTWNFDVTNVGDLPTSTDPAPHDVVIAVNVDGASNEYSTLTASAPGFTCVVTSRLAGDFLPDVVCTATTLAAGGGVVVSVSATAATAADPSFLGFVAAVDPGFQITEFNEANNTGTHTVIVDTP
ncbi:MAG: CARDB domain-containing protein, partial [Gaiellaceae bacterium]